MPGLNLFTSNRMEILADHLADVVKQPLGNPLAAELILVQSKGMERWISMELARRLGVCANVLFPYPVHFVSDLFKQTLPDVPENSPYEISVLTWDIMAVLPGMLEEPLFSHLRRYLNHGDAELKLFQLAGRVAGLFDQYLIFRPEMMLAWEEGRGADWQALLWREIAVRKGPFHRAALYRRFMSAMEGGAEGISLPQRVSLFGLSALPPFYLGILQALSTRAEVNLFLMNPCREFWGDIVSDIAADRLTARRPGAAALKEQDLHLEQGNSLLASMGGLGRDFFRMISELHAVEEDRYQDPADETILASIQSDILNLRQRTAGGQAAGEADLSIQIHSCHSPMREIEALHDHLLDFLCRNPKMRPDDILVMMPAVEAYAPLIQAVFAGEAGDARRIPFSIADRTMMKEGRLIDAFFKILELPERRMTTAEVDDILQCGAVRAKFGFLEEDLEMIRRWISETGIRWGIDGEHKKSLNLPDIPLNTWRSGLDKMILGYALPPGRDDEDCGGIIPYQDIEGGHAEILGRFLTFAELLFDYAARLCGGRPLPQWSGLLREMIDAFFSADEQWLDERHTLRRLIEDLKKDGSAACYDKCVSLNVVRACLREKTEERGFGRGFLGGGVTFCTLLPMRAIPFECICLIGMNGDAYPRQSAALGFDHMAKSPKVGDRTRRDDDRYLFLEALLSARRQFYLSYCGQSLKDNSVRPPSVVVSELADYIEAAFGSDAVEKLTFRHHLQAFNAGYFMDGARLFSFSRENCSAAKIALSPREPATGFITEGLSEPGAEWKQVALEDLARFFANPARFLLNRRLGIYLREETVLLEESEAFELKGLAAYLVKQELLKKGLQGKSAKDSYSFLAADGRLPHGAPGRYFFDSLAAETEELMNKVRPYIDGAKAARREIALAVGDFYLSGSVEEIYGDCALYYRPAKLKPADRIRAWLVNLAASHPQCGAAIGKTVLCGTDAACVYAAVPEAEDCLRALLRLYWQGLRKPLHFFPASSLTYAERTAKGKLSHEAMQSARAVWSNDVDPERDDAYYRLCFGNADPLDDEFQALAGIVGGRMLQYEERLKD